ncbi:MAG: hypothetical protein LBJ87_15605 [bacterium]|jgi:hypothetical protein|nr:hypothetical protein [bacterium]
MAPTQVGLEAGGKRVFVWATGWPGWCRSGRDEEQALAALTAYAPRYAVVAAEAGLPFPPAAGDPPDLTVTERTTGSGGTDFGVPGEVVESDREPLDAAEAERQTALLAAAWRVFDGVVERAPAELRKGPRGGGRDRDKIVDHVLGAEPAYARQLGLRLRQPAADDETAVAAHRQAILDLLRSPWDGTVERRWPPRYAVRRFAWHVLDHAWEIEDRTERQ